MAWNEPGGNNRDPWGGDGRDQGPPDLDEIVRKLSGKFGGLFGGKRPGSGGGGSRPGSAAIWVIAAVVVAAVLLFNAFYIVEEGERGVVLRFGEYSRTTDPGLNLLVPFIERVQIVDVEQRRFEEIGFRSGGPRGGIRPIPKEALMLTQDENIVDVRLGVQYQIKDSVAYLFNVQDPDLTLREVVESAARETVGKSTLDFVLTEGRAEVAANTKTLSQDILDQYGTGLILTNVNLVDAQPPEEVQDAFEDAIKSREDQQRLEREAEAYSNEIIPKARGQAARRLEEAEAYKEQVIAQAEGEASRFEQLLAEYLKAPEVTRERLYIDALQEVLSSTSKVMVDLKGGSSLFLLPLDKLMQQGGGSDEDRAGLPLAEQFSGGSSRDDGTSRFRDTNRSREVR